MRAAISADVTMLTDTGYPDYMLIKNLSTTTSVYIDDNVTGPALYGVEITPLGGITWSPGHPCYMQCLSGTAAVAYVFGTNIT